MQYVATRDLIVGAVVAHPNDLTVPEDPVSHWAHPSGAFALELHSICDTFMLQVTPVVVAISKANVTVEVDLPFSKYICCPDKVPHKLGVVLLPRVFPVILKESVQVPVVEAIVVENVSKSSLI